MSSRICMLSAVLLLVVVGTATARYTETLYYSDAACEDLATRVIVDGTYGKHGLPRRPPVRCMP